MEVEAKTGEQGKPELQKTTETDVYAFGCLYYAVSLLIDSISKRNKTRADILRFRSL